MQGLRAESFTLLEMLLSKSLVESHAELSGGLLVGRQTGLAPHSCVVWKVGRLF